VISSTRDENITALQKESRKSKRRQKQAGYLKSVVLLEAILALFQAVLL